MNKINKTPTLKMHMFHLEKVDWKQSKLCKTGKKWLEVLRQDGQGYIILSKGIRAACYNNMKSPVDAQCRELQGELHNESKVSVSAGLEWE